MYWQSSKIDIFRDFWPQVLTARASFLYTINPISMTFEIWPIFEIFELGWPLLPSWPLFWKADIESVILIYHLSIFNDFWNLTYFQNFWPWVTFVDLLTPFFWKADVKSVILIYNLPNFNDFWNLFLNDPKFGIWPQTQIFFSRNNFQVSLIILSYRT